MTLFYTNSVRHLVEKMDLEKIGFIRGKYLLKKFSDGEMYVRLEQNVEGERVWVLGSTNPPAENLLELLFLLEALHREKAEINLLIPYFGYARQDRVKTGEAFSGKIVCDLLRKFKPVSISVLHMHSPRLQRYLEYVNVIPFEIFNPIIDTAEIIVAPDKGAFAVAHQIGKEHNLPIVLLEKERPVQEKVVMAKIHGSVKHKKVMIVDDMITTGRTITEAAILLREQGAKEISVVATHGVFTQGAVRRIESSPIKKVYVTNSLPQKHRSKKIKVIDLTDFLERVLKTAR